MATVSYYGGNSGKMAVNGGKKHQNKRQNKVIFKILEVPIVTVAIQKENSVQTYSII